MVRPAIPWPYARFEKARREGICPRPTSFSHHEKRIRRDQFRSRITRREFIPANFVLASREQNLVAGNFSLTPPDQNPFRHLPCGLGRHVAMWFTPAM